MAMPTRKESQKISDMNESARWTLSDARELYEMPFLDLLFRSHTLHPANFEPNSIQLSRLLNIKTGGCPEDCGYCSQSMHNTSGLKATKLMEAADVIVEAQKAKASGATRYCMGAAWRGPKARDEASIGSLIRSVKGLGLETCMTLGLLSAEQSRTFANAGLDYYNHNIDTSERFYSSIVTTRSFADRLTTIAHVREAGIKVCSGGIIGLGETVDDRIDMLVTLANLPAPPDSVPINMLIPIAGSRLASAPPVDPIAFVRIVALARMMMPSSFVRLTAGRTAMSDEMQALCFFAGANSMFIGETLLTAPNPDGDRDNSLLRRLGLVPAAAEGGA